MFPNYLIFNLVFYTSLIFADHTLQVAAAASKILGFCVRNWGDFTTTNTIDNDSSKLKTLFK